MTNVAEVKPYYDEDGITIYNGDCRDVLPVLKEVDLAIMSPPYVDLRDYGGHGFPKSLEEFIPWLTGIVKGSVLVAGSAVVIQGDRRRDNCRLWDTADLYASCKDDGIPLFERFIWLKYPFSPNGGATYPDDPLETCLWFGTPTFRHDEVRREYAVSTLKRYSNMPSARFEKNGEKRRKAFQSAHPGGSRATTVLCSTMLMTSEHTGHPAQMPLDVAGWFILAGTLPGQTVIDPFMGSGTTMLSAKKLGRKAIGIEIEERYCEIAVKRLAQKVLGFSEALND